MVAYYNIQIVILLYIDTHTEGDNEYTWVCYNNDMMCVFARVCKKGKKDVTLMNGITIISRCIRS